MKKVLGIIAMAILVSVGRVYADEGMWLPMLKACGSRCLSSA